MGGFYIKEYHRGFLAQLGSLVQTLSDSAQVLINAILGEGNPPHEPPGQHTENQTSRELASITGYEPHMRLK
jgi:hypothetical protein